MSGQGVHTIVREARREHWSYAVWWLLFTMLGAFFAIGAVLLLAYIWGQQVKWGDLGAHGELALYAAALIAPALHPILYDAGSTPFANRRSFGFVGVLLLLVAALLFAGTWAAWKGVVVLNLDQDRLFRISVLTLGLSVLFVFLVALVDAVRLNPDPALAMHMQQEALARSVRGQERPPNAD